MGFPNYSPDDECYCRTGKILQKKKKRINGFNVWVVNIPITQGISGGPVFNNNNEVVGVSIVGTKEHDESSINYGFMPISEALKLL